jgi:N utilization substance protein A
VTLVSEPIRTCVGCGRKAPQPELVRFVAPTGVLERDAVPRRPGRGAYTCRRTACFERATARRAFSRTLRRTVAVPSGLNPLSEEG